MRSTSKESRSILDSSSSNSSAGNAPASTADLEGVVGNDLLVRQLSARPPVLVGVAVHGAISPRLTSGALVSGTITLRDRRPIDVVFG